MTSFFQQDVHTSYTQYTYSSENKGTTLTLGSNVDTFVGIFVKQGFALHFEENTQVCVSVKSFTYYNSKVIVVNGTFVDHDRKKGPCEKQ